MDCWRACGGKQGPCTWCGVGGKCCTRKHGWTDTSNGCDGTFGGLTQHECDSAGNYFIFSNYFYLLNRC